MLQRRGRQAGGNFLHRGRIGSDIEVRVEVIGFAAFRAAVTIIVHPRTGLAAFGNGRYNVWVEPQIRGLVELVPVIDDGLLIQRFSPSRLSVYQILAGAVTACGRTEVM